MKKGYAGKILDVDLSDGLIKEIDTDTYADAYLGGRGVACRLYWERVLPQVGTFDAENCLIFMTGPMCGVPGFAGSRWMVCGKSAIGNEFSYANFGGSWGARLKFAGIDGIIVHGKADKLVYLYIDNGKIEIRNAAEFKGIGAIESRDQLKTELGKAIGVVTIGPAGENMVNFATILSDENSSGSGGLGAVMGSKNLKAIAVKGQGKVDVSDRERVTNLKSKIRDLTKRNVVFEQRLAFNDKLKKTMCYSCVNGCMRGNYTAQNGKRGKFMCQSAIFYDPEAERYYGELGDEPFIANQLCDDFGLDTRVVEPLIKWLENLKEKGRISDEQTGIPLSKIGSIEFIERLVRKIALRKDFGDLLARWPVNADDIAGKDTSDKSADCMTRTGDIGDHGPRLYLTNGLLYAMEPRTPIQMLHEVCIPAVFWTLNQIGVPGVEMSSDKIRSLGNRFWGSDIAADFSVYEGKALAASKIQDRQYAYECLILCGYSWPLWLWGNVDLIDDPEVIEIESDAFNSVTGKSMDYNELYRIGERVVNLQRAILVRERNMGREGDSLAEYNYTVPLESETFNPNCVVPGKGGEVCSRKGNVVDRSNFEKMKEEYYEIRGWDPHSGLQERKTLERLDLYDVAEDLEKRSLLAE